MKNLLKQPLIPKKDYLKFLLVLAPSFNFLAGITFDLHAPSLPALATYFNTTFTLAKATVPISLLGFSLGCLFFGALIDFFGRRSIILVGLLIYTITSFIAPLSDTITQLLILRFIQGFSVSSVSIGCRTIIYDNFKGYDFKIAILYSSLAFGMGPIIAPFIGGFLQYHWGWQANFIAYGVISLILFILFFLYVVESKDDKHSQSIIAIFHNYLKTVQQHHFFPAIIILGLSQVQILTYTTTGAFIIEYIFHRSPVAYGNSALIISLGYLLGTLTNRVLIQSIRISHLINIGFLCMFLGVLLQFFFFYINIFNLFTIIFPIAIIGFGVGFVFINIFTYCLALSISAGVAAAIYTASILAIGALGTLILSHMHVSNLLILGIIFGVTLIMQLGSYYFFMRRAKELI